MTARALSIRLARAAADLDDLVTALEHAALGEPDLWLVEPAVAHVRLLLDRLEQQQHCLAVYGRTVPPPPIPLAGVVV